MQVLGVFGGRDSQVGKSRGEACGSHRGRHVPSLLATPWLCGVSQLTRAHAVSLDHDTGSGDDAVGPGPSKSPPPACWGTPVPRFQRLEALHGGQADKTQVGPLCQHRAACPRHTGITREKTVGETPRCGPTHRERGGGRATAESNHFASKTAASICSDMVGLAVFRSPRIGPDAGTTRCPSLPAVCGY